MNESNIVDVRLTNEFTINRIVRKGQIRVKEEYVGIGNAFYCRFEIMWPVVSKIAQSVATMLIYVRLSVCIVRI